MPCFVKMLGFFCLIFGAGMLFGVFLKIFWIGLVMVAFGAVVLWK